MHILFKSSELPLLSSYRLPDGTTLLESNTKGDPVKRWLIKDGAWTIETDFIEKDRGWKKGEQAAFEKELTPEKVFDYFLFFDESKNNYPQREYSSMASAEFQYFKFIGHHGYMSEEDGNYNVFAIRIDKDSNLDDAAGEIGLALEKIAAAYPKRENILLKISEHTCSEFGIYRLSWDRKDEFWITKTTYGNERKIAGFCKLREALEYIQEHHFA